MSFTAFWRRNKAFGLLALQQNLEYRFNFALDSVVQPLVAALIELTLWFAVFRSGEITTLGGHGLNDYLGYAFWAAFVARITSNWMYEFQMINDIDSGSINAILTRPIAYFESVVSQFYAYKTLIMLTSLWVPLAFCQVLGFPILWHRLPGFLLTLFSYLMVVQLLSFMVANMAFSMTRVGSLTVAKNLAIWVVSGELLPLDLLPEPFRSVLIHLPFANAVYIPVGYLTGRISTELWAQGLLSIAGGILVLGLLARWQWQRGMTSYTGTGA